MDCRVKLVKLGNDDSGIVEGGSFRQRAAKHESFDVVVLERDIHD